MDNKIEKIARRIAADAKRDGHVVSVSCYWDGYEAQSLYQEDVQSLADDRDGDAMVFIKSGGSDVFPEELFEITDYEKYSKAFYWDDGTDFHEIINNLWAAAIVPIILSACTLDDASKACLEAGEEPFADKDAFIKWVEDQDEYNDNNYDWLFGKFPEKVKDAVENAVENYAKKEMGMVGFQAIFDNISFWRHQEDFEDVGLSLRSGYKWFKSRGYNQGDAKIVICKSDGDEDSINHMLWDCPLHCVVSIDDKEMDIGSEMEDAYDYDVEEIVKIVRDDMGDEYDDEIDELLRDALPENPEYVY